MDNLTHSLAGLAIGELVERSLPPEPDAARARVRRKLLLVACGLASNLPDLDLVLTPLAIRPLGYLLHHRGHTHTLLFLIPQAMALLALIWLLWPAARQLLRTDRGTRLATVGVVSLGLLLHIGMDALNVYGVHPFHPFDARWLYGDMVFIVEPVFWVAFGAPLALLANGRAARWMLFALLAGAPLFFTWGGYLPWGSLAGLAALGGLLALLEIRPRPRSRSAICAGLMAAAAFVVLQGFAAHAARQLVLAQLAQRDPASRILDVPLSAFPSNPVCWAFATIENKEAAGTWRVSRGVLSLAPSIMPVTACPAATGGAPQAAGTPAFAWVWEERGQLGALRALRRSNCQVDAWLRFARAPSVAGGEATDVRFGPAGGRNFSTLPYARMRGSACPNHVPGWAYPRADLLGVE